MKVLVVGASGLIGSEILTMLSDEGYEVRGLARHVDRARLRFPEVEWIAADLSRMTNVAEWDEVLDGVDSVVNAAGILQSAPGERVEDVQQRAIIALFSACDAKGIRKVVHISAAGVDAPDGPFMATKKAADDFLDRIGIDWNVLRPGLVVGTAAYGGSAMLRAMASLPWMRPDLEGAGTVRVCSTRDIAAAVRACLIGDVPPREAYDLVGETSMSFMEVLTAFRSRMGLPAGRIVRIPGWIARVAFALGDAVSLLGWRPSMRTTALQQVRRGIDGDPTPWRKLTGHSMSRLDFILERTPPSVQDLWFARMWLMKPIILTVLSLFWIASGLIGIIRHEDAMTVLGGAMPAWIASSTVIGGGVIDILIGLGIALRKTSRTALMASIAIASGYSIGAALFAPWLWADPLGPMVKVLPTIILSMVALAILDDR